MEQKRGSFTGKLGFVLAAAGSAVGLGNLWRFPYLAAQYGGGIFILVYLILAVTFGFSLLILELALGRKTKASALGAYGKLHGKFKWMGVFATLIPLMILPYYTVIAGWVLKYMVVFLTGQGAAAAQDGFFGGFVSQTGSPIVFFAIVLVMTSLIVAFGVQSGVERVSKVMMPVLLVITVGISIYVACMPGAGAGIRYYLLPDFSKFSFKTVCAAMGQLFYSVSIAMGIMVCYGSYVPDEIDLNKSVNQIEIFDTAVAFLAGFMIVPAVYMFSGEEGLATGGAGLMFKTLPKVFEVMPMGNIIGAVFFVLVLLAALTSTISLMEALTAPVMEKFGLSRKKSVLLLVVVCFLLGIPSSLGHGIWSHITIIGMDFLTFFDYISNSVMMPILAILSCVLVGWVVGTKALEDEICRNGEPFNRRMVFRVMIRYVAPICLLIVLITYSLAQFGVITL